MCMKTYVVEIVEIIVFTIYTRCFIKYSLIFNIVTEFCAMYQIFVI